MTPLQSRLALLLASVAIVNGAGIIARSVEGEDVTNPAIDCGPAALLALGSVEGFAIDYDKVADLLPPRPDGHSMKELRDAARIFGMNLEGLYVGKQINLIDRPMLIFIKDKEAKISHFLVVRPIGHTGSLVQLIDSNGPPRIIEKTELVASGQWTGIALALRQTKWTMACGWIIVLTCVLYFSGRLFWRPISSRWMWPRSQNALRHPLT